MAKPAGGFIWYELMTTDPEAATKFYGGVVGWKIADHSDPGAGGMDYRMITRSDSNNAADGGNAGGVLKLTDEMSKGGARPCWLGYIGIDDVDKAVDAIVADGGKLQIPATDIPVGRIALVADPQGAVFYVMKPIGAEGLASDVFSVDQPQHVRWNELQSSDPEVSLAFYTQHFGWTQDGEMDMGPMGKYRLINHDSTMIGAIMPKMPDSPHSVWSYYIGVHDIDRAATAVTAGGGTLNGAIMEIPGGEFSVHASDPQGAAFGLVGPRKR